MPLWDIVDPGAAVELPSLSPPVEDRFSGAAALSKTGSLAAAGISVGSVHLWDVADPAVPRELARITGRADAVYSLHFSPGGDRLTAGVGDGAAWIWDVTRPDSHTTHAVLTAYGSRVYDATF
ncbi:hypothetical protein QNA17_23505, partial [Rhodococcus pyridinivorans]|nr:hypothetical protein [Rhodococcus pyridinivorans]